MVIFMQPSIQINKSELNKLVKNARKRTRIMHSFAYTIAQFASVGAVLGRFHSIPSGYFGILFAFVALELLAIWSIEPISKQEVTRLQKLQSKTVVINSYALMSGKYTLATIGCMFIGILVSAFLPLFLF
jgi:hypothetical protein